jgi:hypothetical protein
MTSLVAVSAAPIAVAFVIGIGAFFALLHLLIADESRARHSSPAPRRMIDLTEAPAAIEEPPRLPTATGAVGSVPAIATPRVSRLRLVATIGALVAGSVWSVRRPQRTARHD